MKVLFVLLLALFLVVSCGTKKAEVVEDIVAAAPGMTKVVLENDYVRAIEFTVPAGEKLPLHKGAARVIYALSDYRILWTEGSESSEKEWQKGQAHWHEAMVHALENIGETEAKFLVVARKEAPLSETGDYDVESDAAMVDAMHSQMVLDNDQVRVTEVQIPAGSAQPVHHGLNRLIYSLSDYTITYSSDKADDKESSFSAGEAHWHGADEHAVANSGETEAQFLIIQFKK